MNARGDDSNDALSALFGALADTASVPASEDDGVDDRWPTAPGPNAKPFGNAPALGGTDFDPAAFGAPRSAAGSPSAGNTAAPPPDPAFPPAPPPFPPAPTASAPAFPPAAAAFPPPAAPPTAPPEPPQFTPQFTPQPAAPTAGAPVYRREHPTFPPAPVTPPGYSATAPSPAAAVPPQAGPSAAAPAGPPSTPQSAMSPAPPEPSPWPADPQERLYVPPQYAPTEPWSPDRDALDAPSWAPPPPQAGPIPIITSDGMPTSRRALRQQAEAAAAQPPPLVQPPQPSAVAPDATSPPLASAAQVPPPTTPFERPVAFESPASPPSAPSVVGRPEAVTTPAERSYRPIAPPQRPVDPRSVPVTPPASVGRPPGGPLLPSATPVERVSVEELERPTPRDWLGLVLSLLPLGGLAVAIARAVQSSRRRGWVIGVVRASLVVGTITTLLGGLGAAAGVVLENQAREHDRIEAESADFCAAFAATPDMLASPTLGWPAPAASIPESIAGMQDYAARMSALAARAPEGVRGGVLEIVSVASGRIAEVSRVRSVDGPANEAAISAAVSSSGVAAWHAEYCAG